MENKAEWPLPIVVFLAVYGISLLALLDFQSLWVDEIIQLLGTRSGGFAATEQLTRSGVGGVIVGWLPQVVLFKLFGFSVAMSRVPSALASIASTALIYRIGTSIGNRIPLLCAILFACLPLQFRYALEGRPYALGVLFGLLATLAFVRLVERPTATTFLMYVTFLILGIYSQPFTSFVGCAHFVWILIESRKLDRIVLITAGGLVFMALAFLPWYVYASPLWRETIRVEGLTLSLGTRTPAMILREISGGGYIGSVLLVLLAGIGAYSGSLSRSFKGLLLISIIVPIAMVLCVDWIFSYFLAIRQMIFILPPLTLLAGEGLFVIVGEKPVRLLGGSIVLIGYLMGADAKWLLRNREDWAAAAQVVDRRTRDYSSCAVYVPLDAERFYAFFQPSLSMRTCTTTADSGGRFLVVVTSPYATLEHRKAVERIKHGRIRIGSTETGMSQIDVYR